MVKQPITQEESPWWNIRKFGFHRPFGGLHLWIVLCILRYEQIHWYQKKIYKYTYKILHRCICILLKWLVGLSWGSWRRQPVACDISATRRVASRVISWIMLYLPAVNDWYDVNNGRGWSWHWFEDPFQKVKLSVCLMECASDQSLSGSSQEDGNTVCTGRWLMSTMFELGWWASLNLLVQISLQYCHVPLAYGGCFGETPSTSISFSLLLGNSFKTAIVVEEMAGLKNQRRNQETS